VKALCAARSSRPSCVEKDRLLRGSRHVKGLPVRGTAHADERAHTQGKKKTVGREAVDEEMR